MEVTSSRRPKPRIAYRSGYDGCYQWWWYLAGELGGGSYNSGLTPDFTPSETVMLRLALGY